MSGTLRDELSGLRAGRGATVAKLKNCPQLLQVLGTDDPRAALDLLGHAVDLLGQHQHALALKNALAIGVANPGNVTQRRINFGAASYKAPDTIKGWEDQMIDELVLVLASDIPAKPDDVEVMAWVVERRIARATRIGNDDLIENPEPGPSLPAFLVKLPDDRRRPNSLTLGVYFDEAPTEAWAVSSAFSLKLSFGEERRDVPVVPDGDAWFGGYRWVKPAVGDTFALCWRY